MFPCRFPSWLLATPLLWGCGGKAERRSDAVPVPVGSRPADPIGAGGKPSGGGMSPGGTNPELDGPEAAAGTSHQPSGAGAANSDPCSGIEPLCEPGEQVCDPIRGVVTACGECGPLEPEPSAKLCVRLIASDKESNVVAAVLGATELQYMAESLAWQPPEKRHEVPAGTREVLLNDDGVYTPHYAQEPCIRTGDSDYPWFTDGISRVAVGDYGACAILDGKVYCRGEIELPGTLPYPILDLAITDGDLFSLSPHGVAWRDQSPRLPEFWRGTPRSMHVDHQGAGCAMSSLDEMACWLAIQKPFGRSTWTGFSKWLPLTLPRACVLDHRGRVGCGDVIEDAAPTFFDISNAVDLVASSDLVCALTRDGHVHCWDERGAARAVPIAW